MFKLILLLSLMFPNLALAHCPLCTIGAGALAIFAASMGVSVVVVGILIGAFAAALGIWISRTVKKKVIPLQSVLITLVIFLLTIVPIMPFAVAHAPLYIPFIGEYGTVYSLNLYIVGTVVGLIIMWVSRPISRFITKVTTKHIPFQGIIVTAVLLIVAVGLIQIISNVEKPVYDDTHDDLDEHLIIGDSKNDTARGDMAENESIKINNPRPHEVVNSPLELTGVVRGTWLFEGDAPVVLTDWNGVIITESYISATDDWMTTEFIPFRGVLEFDAPEDIGEFSRQGRLIFHKDNPSDLRELDESLEFIVYFR